MTLFSSDFQMRISSDAASSTCKHVLVIPSEVEESLAFFRFRTSATDSKRCLDSARHDN